MSKESAPDHGDHARVTGEVVREVEVTGELATKDRAFFPHRRFDEGVPDAVSQSNATLLLDHLAHDPGRTQVVDDRRLVAALDKARCKPRSH